MIDQAYLDKHLPEMELQVLKGGLRAARVLNEIAKDYTGSDPTPEPVEHVLSEILSTVKNSDLGAVAVACRARRRYERWGTLILEAQ